VPSKSTLLNKSLLKKVYNVILGTRHISIGKNGKLLKILNEVVIKIKKTK